MKVLLKSGSYGCGFVNGCGSVKWKTLTNDQGVVMCVICLLAMSSEKLFSLSKSNVSITKVFIICIMLV